MSKNVCDPTGSMQNKIISVIHQLTNTNLTFYENSKCKLISRTKQNNLAEEYKVLQGTIHSIKTNIIVKN